MTKGVCYYEPGMKLDVVIVESEINSDDVGHWAVIAFDLAMFF